MVATGKPRVREEPVVEPLPLHGHACLWSGHWGPGSREILGSRSVSVTITCDPVSKEESLSPPVTLNISLSFK